MIQAMDAPTSTRCRCDYHAQGLDAEVLDAFGISDAPAPDLSRWRDISDRLIQPGRRGDHRHGRQVHRAEGRL